MWKETTQQERNRKIFQEELNDFLPDTILDFHVHVFHRETIPGDQSFSCSGHPISQYPLEELAADLEFIYPNRKTFAVCFGFPTPDYNRAKNNEYLATHCDHARFFPLRLFDPTEDNANIVYQELKEKTYIGLKPYPDYVRKANVNNVEIHEMLPAWVMEIVNELELIVMLHIPRSARLSDSLNQQQIGELCTRYPKAQIILAHIGRAYYLKNIVGQLETLRDFPNLYFDLAMVNHWEVMEYLFQHIPAHRILYGTDIPLALAPGKSVEINDQYTYITPVPWSLSISDDHRKLRFTSFLYEELRAIKKAVQRTERNQAFIEGLFYRNGMQLLQQTSSFSNHGQNLGDLSKIL